MKLLFTLLFSFIFSVAHSQNTLPEPTPVVQTTFDNEIQFKFHSNRALDASTEDRLEDRFLVLHSDLITINIDPSDQSVTLLMTPDFESSSLQTILGRFNVVDYTIVED